MKQRTQQRNEPIKKERTEGRKVEKEKKKKKKHNKGMNQQRKGRIEGKKENRRKERSKCDVRSRHHYLSHSRLSHSHHHQPCG